MSATPDSTLTHPEQLIADLQRQLVECRAELGKAQRNLNETATERDEALAQQTATAEVLQVINSSPGDLAPVFDAMLEKAMRLCEAAFGFLSTYDGEYFHAVALRGVPQKFAEGWLSAPYRSGPNTTHDRLIRGERLVHVPDLAADAVDDPRRRAVLDVAGVRSILGVPLRKEGLLLGAIHIYRQEVRPFTDKQIALAENFAAQAVIAMENARLITETREALEQQTATAEVLQVINSSPGDLEPVFDAILEKAHRLCGVAHGALVLREGEIFRAVATHSYSGSFAEQLRQGYYGAENPITRSLIDGERLLHIPDLSQIDHPMVRASVEQAGVHTGLYLPLRKDGVLLGMISSCRKEIWPFSDKEIALLENFAAQAVIAIENARLLNETREALDQQTATAEVLQVINSSPGDLTPVFEAVLANAVDLCEAKFGTLYLREADAFRAVATHNAPTAFAEARMRAPLRPPPDAPLGRVAATKQVAHIADIRTQRSYIERDPFVVDAAELGGYRTVLSVPMLRDKELIGAININRQEVRPFTHKQIALIESFAAQAVIAIENARLITETREALEQQTATSEILSVISRSPTDVQPVFEAIVTRAARVCEAEFSAVARFADGLLHLVALNNMSPEETAAFHSLFPRAPGRHFVMGRAFVDAQPVHFDDVLTWLDYDLHTVQVLQSVSGYRSFVAVPIFRESTPIGVIGCGRREVKPFTATQIDLVKTFADQAAIALENVRLFSELETRNRDLGEALEQQTATAEVLQVINSSPGDLTPVFDAMLQKALSLCGAAFGQLVTFDGVVFRAAAWRGYEPGPSATAPSPGMALYQLVYGEQIIHIPDITADDVYRSGNAVRRRLADEYGGRTAIWVALRKDAALLGAFVIYRTEVRPFSDKQIALLQNFGAQAVIAIDNAQLLKEIRQRQGELRVTFDNMADGVAMFDGELRLAAWNRNFQGMLDLPDTFLAERPSYAEYFHYLAERGEYGSADLEAELRRAVEDTNREMRFERTRPDGRVIEVRRNAVPAGGFVLIYSDITERKRAEAEISAARDAAQRALQELRAAQASLLHAQKMAALGQLTAGIAHEIKNPLNFVNNFADLSVELLDEFKETAAPAVASCDEDTRAEIGEIVEMLTGNLAKIAEHGRRADGIVKSMLAHSRGGSGDWQSTDINALVEEALNLAYHGARAQDQSFNITLERDLDRAIAPIEVVPQDITRVFLNLFGNGFYAADKRWREAGDSLRPMLKVTTKGLGDTIEVRVRDNGIGIAPEFRDKLFQPFFTTKPTGEGTGLGLSISYDIVTQQHGGTIAVDSAPGAFTEFTIRLPRR
jgi:PAS domain S-box-containing protein